MGKHQNGVFFLLKLHLIRLLDLIKLHHLLQEIQKNSQHIFSFWTLHKNYALPRVFETLFITIILLLLFLLFLLVLGHF
jgi:hypothetical protein